MLEKLFARFGYVPVERVDVVEAQLGESRAAWRRAHDDAAAGWSAAVRETKRRAAVEDDLFGAHKVVGALSTLR